MSYADTVLSLPMNGANGGVVFPDWSHYDRTTTPNGDVQTSTAQSVFYGSSALFDGTGDYLTTTVSGADSTVNDGWRLRVRIRITDLSEFRWIAATRGSISPLIGWQLVVLSSDGKAKFTVFSGSGIRAEVQSGVLSTATWYAIEVGRQGDTYYIGVDGTVIETDTQAGSTGADAPMQIGAAPFSATNRFSGHMQDFHVSTSGANSSTIIVPDKLVAPVAGTITNDVGSPVERRIWVVPRTYPTRLFSGLSDSGDGTYSIDAPNVECARVVLDDTAGTQYNDLIDRVDVAV